MPNHITNELTCENKATLDSLAGGNNREFVDFEKIVPMPDMLRGDVDTDVLLWAEICTGFVNLTTLSQPHGSPVEAVRIGDYGSAADYLKGSRAIRLMQDGPFPKDFDAKRFDQLLNAMRGLKEFGFASWYEWSLQHWGTKWNAYDQKQVSDLIVRFNTAWSAPVPFLVALSLKHPSETFRLRWADEDFGCNVGDVTVKAGEIVSGGRLENSSVEAHALALELIHDGIVPDEYELRDGKLVYVEDAAA